jgi:septation ring formation regulator EzrA
LSKAELLAEQLARAEMPQGSRTSEQAEKSKLKHDLELSLRSKDPQEFRRQAREAMKQGKLQPRDINSIIGDSKLPGLLRRVQNMDATNAAKVYEVATEDERKQIRMAVARKVMNSQTLTNEQKRALLVKSGVIRRPENRPVAAGVQ